MEFLAVAIVASFAAIAGAFGVAIVVRSVVQGIARQPEMRGPIQLLLFIGAPLVEAVPILAIVIAFMLYGSL
ncbi:MULTISPECIES: F0F1 ATP synthase subunit C [Evansella]|uniref:ATP synthase subunit c n=2 Tax=Evansella TaxID=2837485 RepID=A0ABU0A139_9BACI|nr:MULTISPECIES: F0F1 ATP synthase subunit C [Evansella]MBU9712916.1 F0F1 ATP synthase subunit C [Evansella tamaricis]MDQ0257194.1 F-type H+-transporting ATPase subunit c [Evansella vedderi]